MTRASAALPTACALLLAGVATGGEDSLQSGTARQTEVVLPGRVVSYALPADTDGRRSLFALVAPTKEAVPAGDPGEDEVAPQMPPCPDTVEAEAAVPLTLYRIDLEIGGEPLAWATLPPDSAAVDWIADERARRLIVFRESGIFGLPADGAPPLDVSLATLLGDGLARSGLGTRVTGGAGLDGVPLFFFASVGVLTWFGPAGEGLAWKSLGSASLPLRGQATRGEVRVGSPLPRFVGRSPDGTLLLATPPQPVVGQRLKTVRIEVPLAGPARVTESWARLPAAEDLLEHHFLMLDGSAALLVATKPAGELGLFTEKLLRLYRLEQNRSRLGLAPSFAAESRLNLWQEARPLVHDVNGDGRSDLILTYWKGLKDDRVVVDVYRGKEDGGFESGAMTTALDVEDGDRSFARFGTDLDGDELPDLLIRGGGRLLLYRGLVSASGKKLVSRKPEILTLADGAQQEVVVSLSSDGMRTSSSESTGAPRLIDLDGDGLDEILVVEPGDDATPGRFRIVRRAAAR